MKRNHETQTELSDAIESQDMVTVGEWELVEISIDTFSRGNHIASKEKSVAPTNEVDGWYNTWRHSDEKTYLVIKQNSQGKYDAVVNMGQPDSVSVGPGWTCGVDCRHTDAKTAVEWAYNYMSEHDDVSHLYDE